MGKAETSARKLLQQVNASMKALYTENLSRMSEKASLLLDNLTKVQIENSKLALQLKKLKAPQPELSATAAVWTPPKAVASSPSTPRTAASPRTADVDFRVPNSTFVLNGVTIKTPKSGNKRAANASVEVA